MAVEEKQSLLRDLLDAAIDEECADVVANAWSFHGDAYSSYFADTVTVVLDERWGLLSPQVREAGLGTAWKWILSKQFRSTPENRKRLEAFLRRHLDETPEKYWRRLDEHPEIAPLEVWVPLAPVAVFRGRGVTVSREEADRAIARLAKELAEGNAAVLEFVKGHASSEVSRGIFDRMLRSDDAKLRSWAIRRGQPTTSAEALEDAGRALLAEDHPDLEDVMILTGDLIGIKPSAGLFPLVRRLLQGEDAGRRRSGVEYAKSLGQEALVPDLVPLLGSMDEALRNAARDAIQSIQEVTRMKEGPARATPK